MTLDPITVIFEPSGKRSCFETGIRLFDAAKELGVEVRSECGGDGTCGKCKIIIVNGSNLINVLTDREKELLSHREITSKYRLSCQTRIKEKKVSGACLITAFVPNESRLGERKIQVKGMEQTVPLNPAIKKIHMTLDKPTIRNPTADDERVLDKLQEITGLADLELSYEAMKTLSATLRQANWDVTATIWDHKKIIDLEAGDTTNDNYGAAIDIGTSKIVGYVLNLNSGEILSAGMLENPQIQYGEDVLSRIAYATQSLENQEEIRKQVVSGINTVLESACWEIPWLSTMKIHEITVVGNTAMTQLFLGVYSKFLSLSPFTPAVRSSVDVTAKETGLSIHPEGNVHVLPCVAGYVGADAVADVIATGIHEKDEMSLLVDVGTNGEVFLGNKDELLSCSCAAGPAFEGAQIRYGMKAVTGAIEKVRIDPSTLDAQYETIGKRKPIGLCGSAMVDTVAELLKTGIISAKGRFNSETVKTKRLISSEEKSEGSKSYVVAWKDETAINKDITVSTKDISEIQLAKSALHTGCAILMQEKGVTEKDIDKVYIAGAFGNYLNPENARTIGLIPDIPTEKISFVGNTALAGAKMALTSKDVRGIADKLSREIKYIELLTQEGFKREFIDSILLPHRDPNRYPSTRNMLRKL